MNESTTWSVLSLVTLDQNRLADLLKTLHARQEKIVRLYFGLGCQRSRSASEIACEFRVSLQAINLLTGGAARSWHERADAGRPEPKV